MKIGVVLAGGMGNGAYEIGCLRAIGEHFSNDEIAVVSGSSIGALCAYSFAGNKLDKIADELKAIDICKAGKFFPSYSGNTDMIRKIREFPNETEPLKCETYITVWNYTEKSVKYIPIHKLTLKEAQDYLCASVAIPMFNKGVKIKNCTYFDGGFIDNIPVAPMLEKNIDVIFCIYFANQNLLFENISFDRKVIKLYDFPRSNGWDNFTFDPNRLEDMISYGYDYTKRVIKKIFFQNTLSSVYYQIEKHNSENNSEIKKRFTCDTIGIQLNKMTSKFTKRKIL